MFGKMNISCTPTYEVLRHHNDIFCFQERGHKRANRVSETCIYAKYIFNFQAWNKDIKHIKTSFCETLLGLLR